MFLETPQLGGLNFITMIDKNNNIEYNEQELDSPETLEAVEQMIASNIEEKSQLNMNRAQRRAFMHKMGKRGRSQLDLIGDAAKKLNYIDLIQKIDALNKKNKENENEKFTENC